MFAPGDPTNGGPLGNPNVSQLIAQLLSGSFGNIGNVYRPGQPVPNGAGALQALLASFGNIGNVYRPGQPIDRLGPMPVQRMPLPTDGTETMRGNPNGAGNPNAGRFVWGNRTWGPNDFSQFANYLKTRGIDMGQWARAHPMAFASFNIDPNIRHLITATQASGLGQRPAPGGF